MGQDIKIVKDGNNYYVKFRTYHFFGLIKIWWYVLTEGYGILIHRPFSTFENAEKYVENHFERYRIEFESKF